MRFTIEQQVKCCARPIAFYNLAESMKENTMIGNRYLEVLNQHVMTHFALIEMRDAIFY